MHLLIIGAPGSGKGTAAVELKNFYGIPHISTGDMFRQAIQDKTEIGLIAKDLIENGKFVPDEVTCKIVEERLASDDCKKGFLLDGFPRNMEQAKALTEMLDKLNIKLDAAINLEIEENVIIERIVNRRLCSSCGKGYNLLFNKPNVDGICNDCGSPLYQRKDDNLETIQTRLDIYKNQTEPIVSYYEKLGILVNVNSNQSKSDVVKDIIQKVNNI